MNVDERMITYIRSLDRGENERLRSIEQEAVRDRVPIIRKETAGLLKVLLRMQKPEKLLEVGAAVGFSSILMSEYIKSGATITTIRKV